MKKLLLLIATLAGGLLQAQTVTTICNDFSSGVSQYPDPSSQLAYSVSNGKLTLTFTDYTFWGDEVKWDFPSTLDLTGQATGSIISFNLDVSNVTISGTGTCPNTNNYVLLGISLYDAEGDYTNGTSSGGYWDVNQDGTHSVNTSNVNFNIAAVKGIAIKAAEATYANCTSPKLATGTVTFNSLKIGTGNCTASIFGSENNNSQLSLFPNPVNSDDVNMTLSLPSASEVEIIITDVMGRERMKIEESSVTELSKTVNVSSLNEGVYHVSYLVNGVKSGTEMLVVQ